MKMTFRISGSMLLAIWILAQSMGSAHSQDGIGYRLNSIPEPRMSFKPYDLEGHFTVLSEYVYSDKRRIFLGIAKLAKAHWYLEIKKLETLSPLPISGVRPSPYSSQYCTFFASLGPVLSHQSSLYFVEKIYPNYLQQKKSLIEQGRCNFTNGPDYDADPSIISLKLDLLAAIILSLRESSESGPLGSALHQNLNQALGVVARLASLPRKAQAQTSITIKEEDLSRLEFLRDQVLPVLSTKSRWTGVCLFAMGLIHEVLTNPQPPAKVK